MLTEVLRRQERILVQLDLGDRLLGAAEPDPAALASVRWRLARELRCYQIFKQGEVFATLIRDRNPYVAARAGALQKDCLAASAAGKAFILAWSGRESTEWPAYAAACLAMNAQIRRHLALETHGLVELAGRRQSASTARRPSAAASAP